MTSQTTMAGAFGGLLAKYRPVIDRIAAGAAQRELSRTLPVEQIQWLKESGFTAARVPAHLGGDGAGMPELFGLLVELAAADPNVAQALRGHFAFVEDRLYAPDGAERDAWLRRFAAGEIVGNAVTEVGGVALSGTATRLAPAPGGGWTITGRKYYATGSLFAEWIDATALDPDGTEVAVLVATGTDAVVVTDDWTGFGQRLTGSGSVVFDRAPVRAGHVQPFTRRFPYQTAFYQLVLDAVLAGIARAAERDLATEVARRTRSYSHANTPLVRQDPQILELAGRVSATAFAAEAAVEKAARVLRTAADARGQDAETVTVARREAELASAQAQLITADAAVDSASRIFDALGASATGTAAALDRHWRNARTVRSHNPVAFKARIIGDALINGSEPPYEWSVGTPQIPSS
ncbi:acyl-CoA dehydrogenase family protein [Streptomyces sp. NPDC090075]|uniref:acyl-CoA dehydrogenase family protein n=1 Tax=Streptomyces sp. NPDC090075 TaxID=3365937 RepID=UPI0037F453A2